MSPDCVLAVLVACFDLSLWVSAHHSLQLFAHSSKAFRASLLGGFWISVRPRNTAQTLKPRIGSMGSQKLPYFGTS